LVNVAPCNDPGRINVILNHPDVFPFVAVRGIAVADTSPLMTGGNVVFIVVHDDADVGGILFRDHGRGVFSLHVAFLPSFRAKRALAAVRHAIDVFLESDRVSCVVADVPEFNRMAIGFARMLGGRFQYKTNALFYPVIGDPCRMKRFIIATKRG
jgi:hypothetical protein